MTKAMLMLNLMVLACAPVKKTGESTVRYFETWGGYRLPRIPQREILSSDVQSRSVYYEATYDQRGRMLSFRKYSSGRIEWEDRCSYQDDEAPRCSSTKPDP